MNFMLIWITLFLTTLIVLYPEIKFNSFAINNEVAIYDNRTDPLFKYKKIPISTNEYNITVALAFTDDDKINGLSGLDTLPSNEGMLFLFDKPSKQGFWMKDMNFPIDIIWLNSNDTVVHIEKRLDPCKSMFSCPVYSPENEAVYVLEVNSGFSDKYGIKEGTNIRINLQ